MSSLLISLVSEQTIPNILGILHYKPDYLLFISTPDMIKKEKVEHILDAIKVKNQIIFKDTWVIKTEPENMLLSIRELNKWFDRYKNLSFNKIIVNLTCGTKIMSLAVYDFFKNNNNNIEMVYIPIKENKILHLSTNKKTNIKQRLDVVQYLFAYGVKINQNFKKIEQKKEKALNRFTVSEFIYKKLYLFEKHIRILCQKIKGY